MVSLPAAPIRVSSPPPPVMTLVEPSPVKVSAPEPPVRFSSPESVSVPLELPVAVPVERSAVTPEELREYCRRNAANFKVPRQIWPVDSLPYLTAANGSKLQRNVVREWVEDRAGS